MEAIDIFSYFLLLLLLLSGIKVVTTSNVIHAAIFLVFTLATTAVLFILLFSFPVFSEEVSDPFEDLNRDIFIFTQT